MSAQDSIIIEVMNDEALAMQELVEILTQEQEFLIDGSLELLSEVTEGKSRCLIRSSELAQRRYRALQAANQSPDENGMRAWLAVRNNDDMKQAWKKLFEITAKASELNRVNGMLIGKHLSRNSMAMHALNNTHRNSGVYGPDGQTTRNISRGISV